MARLRNLSKDTWLYGKAAQERLRQEIVKSAGKTGEASSDQTFRSLMFDPTEKQPLITNWGSVRKSADGTTVAIRRDAPEVPPSRQLKDPFTSFYVQGIALEPPLPPDRLLNLTEENPIHGACLMAKAYDACGRGWGFEPREGKDGDEELEDDDTPDELKIALEDLTPELTFDELLYQAAWEMDGIGWGVWEVVRVPEKGYSGGNYAPIGAIYPVPSHTIRASLDPRKWVQIRAGRVRYFKKFGVKVEINAENGTVLNWKSRTDRQRIADMDPEMYASELIIFKHYTPRSMWYGVPRWVSGIATIAELTAIREFNVSWFASGGQTDYHMHVAAESMDTSKEIVSQVEKQMEDNAGRGHTLLLTAGTTESEVTVNKLGELLREGHFRFRRGDLAKEVLIAHNVPPYRIGWAETGSLGGNAAQEMLGAYKFGAIEPIQTIIESRLRKTLFNPDLGGIKTGDFWFTLEDLDLDDLEREMTIVGKSVDQAIMTPNQGRKRMGMDPDEDHPELDKYYYKGQELGKEPAGGGFEIDPATGQPKLDDNGQPIPKAPAPLGGPPKPGQPGQPAPKPGEEGQNTDGQQKVVDKVVSTIAAFETALRNMLTQDDEKMNQVLGGKRTKKESPNPSIVPAIEDEDIVKPTRRKRNG